MGILRKLFSKSDPSDDDRPGSPPIPSKPPAVPSEGSSSAVSSAGRRRVFDIVQDAEAAAKVGEAARAEGLFREAIELDRRPGSLSKPDYPLGRFGAFLEEQNRPIEAIAAYEEAVRGGTDIPAIYAPLLRLYADRGDEESVFRTADLYQANSRVESAHVVDGLVRLATERSKAGANELAERWLVRTEGWVARHGDRPSQFKVWGERGHAVERSGDLARAVTIYEQAVAAGSTDRKTFTRLLMAYEQGKRWSEAYELAHRALGVQRDATWELDLRTRIARFDAKSSGTSSPRAVVPAFSVRRGGDRVSLVSQATPKLPVSKLAPVSNQLLVYSSGSSRPNNFAAYDLSMAEVRWTATVPGPSAELAVLGELGCVAATDHGKIGDGGARLTFFDWAGNQFATVDLPDKLSQVRSAGDLVVAGCRDGYLYAFDLRGALRWRFQVPSRADLPVDQPAFRPCPYLVEMSAAGRYVLFSSWDTVYLVDDRGKLAWTWTTPTRQQRFHYTVPLDRRTPDEHYYRVLGLATTDSMESVRRAFRHSAMATHPDRNPSDPHAADRFRQVVQAYEAIVANAALPVENTTSITFEVSFGPAMTTIYGVAIDADGNAMMIAGSDGALTTLNAKGEVQRRQVASDGAGYLATTRDLSHVVYAHWGGLNAYDRSGLVGVWETDRLHQVRISPDGRHVVSWNAKTLLILTAALGLVAEIEFARNVSDVAFTGQNQITVASGKLIRLSFQ